jgi:hypothetical protein
MHRVTRSSPQLTQLPLFRPLANKPRWESLPANVRQEALALLVQCLRAHARGAARAANREVHDE